MGAHPKDSLMAFIEARVKNLGVQALEADELAVAIEAGDRDAAQMAAEISRPVEVALRSVPGVTRVRSTTSRGTADVALNFAWGEDMVSATLATQGALATLLPDLPVGTRFDVRRSDPTIFPVLGIALTVVAIVVAALLIYSLLLRTAPKVKTVDPADTVRRVTVFKAHKLPVRRQWHGYGTAAAMDTARLSSMPYLAKSSRAQSTAAAPPSLVGQHWNRVSGSAIIREFSTSSMV